MKRQEFLDVLRKVAPALASREYIPILACLCFTPKTVTAYDDIVALSTPLASGLKGGIKGEVLLKWLGECRAPEIEIEQTDAEVKCKSGRSKITLSTLPPDDFVFEWPAEAGVELPLNESLVDAIKKCMVSMGNDPSQPWQSGITVAFEKKRVKLYSTNNMAAFMTAMDFVVPKALRKLVLLMPPRFCQLLVSLAGKEEAKVLVLNKEWVEAKFASGLRLFGKASKEASLEEYGRIFNEPLTKKADKLLVDVPKKLSGALARNLTVFNGGGDKFSRMVITDGKLKVSSTGAGEVTDKVSIPGHPDCEVELSPEVLSSALDHSKQVCFIEGSCAVIKGKGFTRVVAVVK